MTSMRRLSLPNSLYSQIPQFVVAFFPVGHEGGFGHGFTRFLNIGFNATVNCDFCILAFGEALAVFDDRTSGGN